MFCFKCGKPIPNESNFCLNCGNKVDKRNRPFINDSKPPENAAKNQYYQNTGTVSPLRVVLPVIAVCIALVLILGIVIASTIAADKSNPIEVVDNTRNNSNVYSTESAVSKEETTPTYTKKEIKAYGVGETWIVDGEWTFTIDAVTKHTMCNEFSELNTMAECVIITYSYENIGYTDDIQDLYFCSFDFLAFDSLDEAATLYPCTHTKDPQPCVVGTKCSKAQQAYALNNESHELTLVVQYLTSDYTSYERAKFVLTF